MKQDNIYFGEAGMTSASANHVANMAKESIREIQNDLDAVTFYNATVCLLSGGTPQQCAIGSKREVLDKCCSGLRHRPRHCLDALIYRRACKSVF
jgi:hypothetical protein